MKDETGPALNEIKKLTLGVWPTPIQELRGFRDILGDGKRLFLKQDDLCGIGLGGNKARKLEYLLADALNRQCGCIVTGGGALSNQPIAAAARAAKAGLKTYLVLPESRGTMLRNAARLFGTEIFFAEKSADVPKGIRSTDCSSFGCTPLHAQADTLQNGKRGGSASWLCGRGSRGRPAYPLLQRQRCG